MSDAQLIEWALANGWTRRLHSGKFQWLPQNVYFEVPDLKTLTADLRAAIQADRRRKLNAERKKVKA